MLPRRLITIAMNGLRWGLVPVFGMVLSWLVFRFHSAHLWGDFVGYFLWVTLAATVLNWGNKEYLLRAFSQSPQKMLTDWQTGLSARVVFLPLAFFFFWGVYRDVGLACALTVWVLALVLVQSYEVCVLYQKSFDKAVGIEVAGFVVTAAAIWGGRNALDVHYLIHVFLIAAILKAAIFVFFFQTTYPLAWVSDGWMTFLKDSFPFFLIGLSGLLNSRADAYVATACLDNSSLGQYQVLTNLVIYVQSAAALVLAPFVKNIYRLPAQAYQKLVARFLWFGIAVSFACVPLFWGLLTFVYGFAFEWPYFIAIFLLCLPTFGTAPIIYKMYDRGLETLVIWIGLGGTILLVVLSFWLMPHWGVLGGLMALVAAKWSIWISLHLFQYKELT